MRLEAKGLTDPARDIFKIFSEYAARYAKAHASYFTLPADETSSTAATLKVLAEVILARRPRSDVEVIDLLNVVSFFDPARPWMATTPIRPTVSDAEYYRVLSEMARLIPLPLQATSDLIVGEQADVRDFS
jgi:hypothetical protein